MKTTCFKPSFLLLLSVKVIIITLLCSNCQLHAASDTKDNLLAKGIVADLQVNDIPYDDGTGLILSWIPLPKEQRIIEYRVYRGISPDSLFHIASLEVDPILGVSSPKMFYSDRDFSDFVSIYSPGKLRREAQQANDSPLYRFMPRDINVYSNYLNHYTILGVIDKDDFYYRSRPIVKENATEDGEVERTVYAGLPLRSFEGMYSMLKSGKTYYYTVLAVNQQRKFLPYAPLVSGIPEPNKPAKPEKFEVVVLKDTGAIQFEWSNPAFADDLLYRNIYIVSSRDNEAMQEFLSAENSGLSVDTLSNPASLIYASPSSFPYPSTITGQVLVNNNGIEIVGDESFFSIDLEQASSYRFILSFTDYSGHETFSDIVAPRVLSSDDKPTIPPYKVIDKPDDKGDYNHLIFGKPLVFLTQASFSNRARTRMMINYDYNDNLDHRLLSAIFRFYDSQGNLIQVIDEFYLDKQLSLRIPNQQIVSNGLKVVITPDYSNHTDGEQHILTQTMRYNDEFGFIEFGELIVNEDTVSEFNYYLYKRSKAEADFRLARVISPFLRGFDDHIPYETSIFKGIDRVDLNTNLILLDNTVSVTYDQEAQSNVVTNIFGHEIENDLLFFEQKVAAYQEEISTADESEIAMLNYYIEYYQSRIDMERSNPFLVEANSKENDRRRMRFISDLRERHRRSFEYIFIRSDGKALFSQDEIFVSNGETYLFPTSDWFNSEQLPTLIASLIFGLLVFTMITIAKKGKNLYIRPIAGLEEIDNAIGRATEMGKPVLFVPGIGYIEDIATLAALSILSHVARKAAEYDTRVMVPVADYIVLPVAMETVKESHISAGRPDTFNRDDIFYIAGDQFAFVAGVNGIMIRNKTVVNFFLGVFFAEALIMTETGNSQGAVQIAGSDSVTQIPFFITTCDYTLIGEELYGASAYLARDPMFLGTLKAQDYTKFLILVFIVGGTILSTLRFTFLINTLPSQ